MHGKRFGRGLVAFALCAFVLTPLVAVVGASLSEAPFWQFPPKTLTLSWYVEFFTDPVYLASIQTSFFVALMVVVAGVPIAFAIALVAGRLESRWTPLILAAALLPLLFPEIGLGLAVYVLYVSARVPFNPVTLAFAQLVVILPFAVAILAVALQRVDRNLERAALNLGASPFQTTLTVTAPIIRASIIAAIILTFVRSFDDVGIGLFVNSPSTVPLAVRLVLAHTDERGPFLAVGGVTLLAVGLVVVFVMSATIGIRRGLGIEE